MESAFIFGCFFGMGLKMSVCRIIRKPYLFKCYQYPQMILLSGIGFSAFDWVRRLSLENLCEKEEMQDHLFRLAKMNYLTTGAEQVGDYKREFVQMNVEEHIY